jgi:excisionase family DNA binding protein
MTSLESASVNEGTTAPNGEDGPPDPAVLTIEELAGFLRVNHKTVRDAIARGEIPGVRRIGGTFRIYRDAVISWLSTGQGRVSHSRRSR